MLSSIVPLFINRASDRLAAMRQAGMLGNLKDLGAAAHELKGASGTVGAVRVEALCLELELAGRPGAPAPREGLLDELEVELASAAEQLTEFVSVHS
jgi:HPt (histidine-containing phosphotransfer) domain-containing protein